MNKLNMQTTNIVDENIKRIGELFPNCLTERLNDEGKPELAIDFDQLRQELSKDIVEGAEERYQFTWPDKRNAIRLANAPTTDTLRPCREESVDFDNTQNLYIEGDNLEVLKLLRENYLGKVKMIYIDPPYNTGNDFVYNDEFNQESQHYIHNSGQFDEEGNRLVANTESNGRFHTDWLNMIYPRLKVAKDLLSEDGVIFISIDDNEVRNLKFICDEIFGGTNFVSQLVWQQGRKSAGKSIAINHEYCLVYAKRLTLINAINNEELVYWKKKKEGLDILYNEESLLRSRYGSNYERINDEYKSFLRELPENSLAYNHKHYKCIDERGIYFPADASAPDHPETRCHKALIHPVTNKPCSVPRLGWRYNERTLDELYKNGMFHFGVDETTIPCVKRYLKSTEYEIAQSVFYKDGRGASNRLVALFGGKKLFDFPKDEYVIEQFVKYVILDDKESFVLDFFSGSATTAHAVMQLNAEDGGKRKFIMVQLPEPTDEKSEAYKAGYKNICEIGKERIRRAGKKIIEDLESRVYNLESSIKRLMNAQPDNSVQLLLLDQQKEIAEKVYKEQILPKQKELDELRARIATLDTGFRVLKLDSSNMQDVYYTPADFDEKSLFEDNIKGNRTEEDLLFQVMIEFGIELSAKIEKQSIAGKTVWSVSDGYLMACFDTQVNETAIKEIAKQQPYYFVMRDASLATDNVADNFEQIWQEYSKDTIRRIL